NLCIVHADGTQRVEITFGSNQSQRPAWSPDGTRIEFDSTQDGSYDLFTINPDGTGQINLTNSPDVDEVSGSWSPDGSKIAFKSFDYDAPAPSYDVDVINSDGTGLLPLAHSPNEEEAPAWSPDGTTLAFVGSDASGNEDIRIMQLGSSKQVDITNNPAFDYGPKWQPVPCTISGTQGDDVLNG